LTGTFALDNISPNEKRMKRNFATRTLWMFSFATLYMSLAATAQAQGPACSLAQAAGTYGASDSGTVVGVGPRAFTGIFTLDAVGNLLNGKGTSSLNGAIADETFSGPYTVNSDCAGTLALKVFDPSGNLLFTARLNLAWDDDMRELRFIFTSVALPDGTPLSIAINGNARKLVP
jgi:hypothetical protein